MRPTTPCTSPKKPSVRSNFAVASICRRASVASRDSSVDRVYYAELNHLKQRLARPIALRLQLRHQLLKGQFLVRIRPEGRFTHSLQQLPELGRPIDPS